jgi:hypothetical protein
VQAVLREKSFVAMFLAALNTGVDARWSLSNGRRVFDPALA